MLHPYTKCLTKVLQVSLYFQMKIWDLVKSSELAWSIEDLGKHNAPTIDYLFEHKGLNLFKCKSWQDYYLY
jgi:hypothetical protein